MTNYPKGIAHSCLLVANSCQGFLGPVWVGRVERQYKVEIEGERNKLAAERAALTRHKAIETLCDVAYRFLKIDAAHDLRVTILELDRSGEVPMLRQVARCKSGGPCGLTDSFMSISQGVAGYSFRKTSSVTVNVPPGEFIKTMLDFGFTKEEAKLFEERGAYLCCPVLDERRDVIGVLSLDALTPEVFDVSKTEIAQQVTPLFAQWLTDPDREVVANE